MFGKTGRKRRGFAIALLSTIFTISLFGTAYAEIREFSRFMLDVPETWRASEENGVITLMDNDQSASITLRVLQPRDTLENTATFLAKETGGTVPVKDGGIYRFTFDTIRKDSSISTRVMLGKSDDGSEFCMISVTGEHPDVNHILRSMQGKD